MWRKRGVLLSAAVGLGWAMGSAVAADLPYDDPMVPAETPFLPLPAVSGPNGKFAVFGGGTSDDLDDGAIFGGEGSFSFPIGDRFGAQLDGFGMSVDDELVAGGAGHFFWRDPNAGLIGVYGGGAINELYDFNSYRAGLEGEAYLGRFSIEGLVGWERRDFDAGGEDDDIFALADVAFYVTDYLRVSGGYRRWNDMDIAAVGTEYQLPWSPGGSGAALFAEGRIGDDEYASIYGGLRFYFGAEPKSLIRRHREDDPRVRLEEEAAGNSGAMNPNGGSGLPECTRENGLFPPDCIPPAGGSS